MQRLWSADELEGRWTLGSADLALLAGQTGRFPDTEAAIAPAVVGH